MDRQGEGGYINRMLILSAVVLIIIGMVLAANHVVGAGVMIGGIVLGCLMIATAIVRYFFRQKTPPVQPNPDLIGFIDTMRRWLVVYTVVFFPAFFIGRLWSQSGEEIMFIIWYLVPVLYAGAFAVSHVVAKHVLWRSTSRQSVVNRSLFLFIAITASIIVITVLV